MQVEIYRLKFAQHKYIYIGNVTLIYRLFIFDSANYHTHKYVNA